MERVNEGKVRIVIVTDIDPAIVVYILVQVSKSGALTTSMREIAIIAAMWGDSLCA